MTMKINPVYFQRNVKKVSNLQKHLTDIKTERTEKRQSTIFSKTYKQASNKIATTHSADTIWG